MKKLFLSVIAGSMILTACNQPAKTAKTADSSAAQPAAAGAAATAGTVTTTAAVTTTAPVMSNGPAMKFEYVTHDFGKITQGDKVTYKFNFANVGKAPLIISNAVASCGCTTPVWPKGPILPGAGGQIVVTFNSLGKMGLQDKMITITANTNPPQNVVHLVGEVLQKK